MNLAQFSVRQTVLVNVLFFVCMLAGWAAFQRIPVEFFPDLNLNTVNVTTAWIGASADEVERLVTRKLEKEIGQVTDIQEMRSTSRADLSQIVIDFDEDLGEVQYEAALNDVRAAIDRVRDLPADVKQSNILEIKSNEAFPAVAVAVVDMADVGRKTLREVARELSSRLERVPGVSRVMARGTQDREIRVLVDRDAAARYGLTVSDVADRIRRKNLNLPAGTFGTGSAESTLRARGDYQNPEEILATVVRENPNGTVVRLAEIARLEDGLEKRLFASRYNGKPAEILTLVKKSGADVLDLSAAIEAWIETQSAHLPAGVEIYKTLDTADFVGPRMRNLVQNLLTGVVFVVAILWFTIGFRNAVLTSIAIPFSFLTAMILFPPLGISINATTLVGMLLVSGMLVDDAIIVLENVYQHIEEGEPLREAVVNGTQEVMWPVVAAVATTVAAFLPLLLVTGTMGKFVSILPKAVVVCLAASLFECLVILPAHYLHFGSRKRPDEADVTPGAAGRFARLRLGIARFRLLGDRGIRAARAAYSRALDHVLANRGAFAALAIGVLVFSAGWARHLPVVAFPGEFEQV
ncbi:MAG: efflux RND transporter permease subunit, partial [Proteobacteria bacterium]|nr:efflux RND transporter permease subunit [Pseudomonadota bacterium]